MDSMNSRRNPKLLISVLCGLWLFLLLASGCSPAASSPRVAAVRPVTVEMRQLRFEPEEIRIPAGVAIPLRLDNLELLPHSLDIDALDIHIPLAGQEQKTITLPELAAGEYEVYCGVPGHREAGMVSRLIVE